MDVYKTFFAWKLLLVLDKKIVSIVYSVIMYVTKIFQFSLLTLKQKYFNIVKQDDGLRPIKT